MLIIISLLILGIGACILYLSYNHALRQLKQNVINNNQKDIQELQQQHKNLVEKENELYKKQLEKIQQEYNIKNKEYENQKQLFEKELAHQKETMDIKIKSYYNLEKEKAKQELNNEVDKRKNEIHLELTEYISNIEKQKQLYEAEKSEIAAVLEEYKSKQAAINEEIRRKRELERKQDMYRIKINEFQRQDISYLLSIVENLKNPQILYKLIWSEYLQKPFAAMLKNEFGANEPRCVIYKITNIKTQEAYIGRTKGSVGDRWASHIKTSLNIGTAAKSAVHDALFGHWGNFVFEVLEEVEDESNLGEREKFYIKFYQTDIYGYNQNHGG